MVGEAVKKEVKNTLKKEHIQYLIAEAKRARHLAYAPYSRFLVGAALETKEGKIFSGCNIENAAYGVSMCAERVAVFKAVSEGFRDFIALAVVTGPDGAAPCGACRQVLAEFNLKMSVIMANLRGEYRLATVSELLPDAFTGADLFAQKGKYEEK